MGQTFLSTVDSKAVSCVISYVSLAITFTFVATLFSFSTGNRLGYAVAQLFEALRYKPEGRGFDSRCHWNFSLA